MDRSTLINAVSLGVGGLGLVASLFAHRRISAARRSLSVLQGGHDGKTLLDAVASYVGEARALKADLGTLSKRQEELFAKLGHSKRHVGVVRYDAFEDMGGRMSFSAALLDDHGSGLVLTSINGRTEARTYAKTVEGGNSEHNLSPEEQEAIATALGQRTKVRR